MADISLSFSAEGGISLDDLVGIFTGTNDPSVVGETAPIGSLFIQQNGQLFQKIDSSDTSWIKFSQGIGDVVRIDGVDTTSGYLNDKLVVTTSSLDKSIGNVGGNEYISLDLANAGVAGTYTQVTTDAKGRVVVGANPTTLSGYGIVDAQPLDATLSALAGFNSNGLVVQTATNTFVARTITGTPYQITIVNGDGIAGNPVISLPSSMLTLPGTEGFIPPIGTTAQRVDVTGYTRFNATTHRLEYFDGTEWVSVDPSTGGTVTSVAVSAPAQGIQVSGSPITTSGTISLSLSNDLGAVEGLATFGLAARTATDTWTTRTIAGTTGRVAVSNGDGIAGNPTIDIDAAYVGQTSITTVGTISTGVWQGTPVGTQFGGTGRSTLGPANTLLGVDTTGTGLEYKQIVVGTGLGVSLSPQQIYLTNTGVQKITGTAYQISVSPATGTGSVTLSLPQNIDATASPTFAQATITNNPTQPQQVATKNYVDSVVQGLNVKAAVRAASAGVNYALTGLQTVDGVALNEGDRVLLKDQTTSSQNGIYVASAGAWVRSSDMNTWAEVPAAFTFVQEGATLQDTGWICSDVSGGTLETTAITWVQFSSAGIVIAGTGLTKSGNTLYISTTGVSAGAGYNNFTVNAQGQITAASIIPYITGNQTIVLGGDVTGSGTNAITTTLSATGVAAGTYTEVTVDAKGRVLAGANPNTLAGYGIVDAQPLSTYLTSIADLSVNGIIAKNGNFAESRAIVAASSKLAIVNGDGVNGNPTIDVVESALTLDNIGGTLGISKGGTNLTTLGTTGQILTVNSAATGLEYVSFTGNGITITPSDTGIEFATINNGTVTSIDVLGSTGLTSAGGPITSSGTIQLTLGAELQGLSVVASNGLVTRTATGTYTSRSVVSGASTITITNPQGTAGNIGLDLSTVGTPGNYYKVTTDIFGRVTSGATTVPWSAIVLTPTTLAGYGITDAQPLSSVLTGVASSSSGIIVKSGGNAFARTIQAGSAKITISNGDGVAANPSVDLGTVNLTDLADVVLSSPNSGDSLVWNGTDWVNGSVTPKLYAEHPVAQSSPTATGDNSIALGSLASAGAHDSLAFGPQSLSRLPGITQANGRFGQQGDAQAGSYIVRTGTINGTPNFELFLDGTNGSERLTLTTDTTWVWEATIIAHRTDTSGDHAGFKLKGVIYCGASLNSITMLGNPIKEILARSNTAYDVSAVADTTHGSLKIMVTGAAGHTIRWMALVETKEITN